MVFAPGVAVTLANCLSLFLDHPIIRSLRSPRTGRTGTVKFPSQILCITRTCRSCRRWELSNINETINIMTAAPKIAPHQTPWINPEPSIINPRPPSPLIPHTNASKLPNNNTRHCVPACAMFARGMTLASGVVVLGGQATILMRQKWPTEGPIRDSQPMTCDRQRTDELLGKVCGS